MSINIINKFNYLTAFTNFVIQNRCISTTVINNLIQSWRKNRGLPLNPNSNGILTDRPDYTFLDGRPTPLGTRMKKRIIKQREIATKIIQLSSEIDFAVKRHKHNLEIQEQERKKILDNKLQKKGYLLLKNKN